VGEAFGEGLGDGFGEGVGAGVGAAVGEGVGDGLGLGLGAGEGEVGDGAGAGAGEGLGAGLGAGFGAGDGLGAGGGLVELAVWMAHPTDCGTAADPLVCSETWAGPSTSAGGAPLTFQNSVPVAPEGSVMDSVVASPLHGAWYQS
jgi:hypothetical protein